jgi:hypothetical protein
MAVAGTIENIYRVLRGEPTRARVAGDLLERKAGSVSQLSPSLRSVVVAAAERGSSQFLQRLEALSIKQKNAAARVSDVMVKGGFVALPHFPGDGNIEGRRRYHDATIIPLTDEARTLVEQLPHAPSYLGGFSSRGERDTTASQSRDFFASLGLREGDLPRIKYEPVLILPQRGRIPFERIEIPFEYRLYYLPPGTHENMGTTSVFRGTNARTSQEIKYSLQGAVGRELVGRAVGAFTELSQLSYEVAVTSGPRGEISESAQSADTAVSQMQRLRKAESRIVTALVREEFSVGEVLDPLFEDMVAISKRLPFSRRKR